MPPGKGYAIINLIIDKKCEEDRKMTTQAVSVSEGDLRKLLAASNSDAALLYLYLKGGNPADHAEADLRYTQSRLNCAEATLRQLGLWQDTRSQHILPGARPAYSEQDVTSAMDTDTSFRSLYNEVQKILGRVLNTEELKILLGFVRYLGLPSDVVFVMVVYCRDRARQKGSSRNPSLRAIEKEAYAWAEKGIDTMEEASAYIQAQNLKNSRLYRLMELLQIRGRNLTAAEERYAASWMDMGFEDEAIGYAYEKTCLNTGGLNWAYMNKILQRWHQQGLHSVQAIQSGDRKPTPPKGGSGELGEAELEAIARALREE